MADRMATAFKTPSNPTLQVVWQVCHENELLPDLLRIAEMDEEAADKVNFQFSMKLVSASLRRATEGPRRLGLNFKLMKPDGEVSKHASVQTSPLASTWPQKSIANVIEGNPVKPEPDEECANAVWMHEEEQKLGWNMSMWAIRESRISLLSYTVEATLLMYSGESSSEGEEQKKDSLGSLFSNIIGAGPGKKEDKPTKIGVWRESLGDLFEAMENTDHGIICDAVVESRDGQEIAQLRLEMDLFAGQAHRMPAALTSGSVPPRWPLPQAPLRKGVPAQEIWQNKIQYYCMAMVDGLHNHETCYPYVRISMGPAAKATDSTEAKQVHSVYNVTFDKPLAVQTTLINRKAKVEILSKTVFGEDKLLGQGVLYDINPDKEYWIHCYGGSSAPNHPEIALQMTKGAVRPPSTYSGSVAVRFGTKVSSRSFFDHIKKTKHPYRLKVKLHSGANLTSFADQRVTVILKAACCRLPDEEGARHIRDQRKELHDVEEKLKDQKHVTQEGETVAKLKKRRKEIMDNLDAKPENYNTNLLSFPGEVDSNGILNFTDPRAAGKKLAWVERTTPKDWPLQMPPDVQHCYAYIVAEGEEASAPKVFGRFRLTTISSKGKSSSTQDLNAKGHEEKTKPKWKRLRFDTSVVETPQAFYKSDLAGFLLGSAVMVEATGQGSGTGTFPIPALDAGESFQTEQSGCGPCAATPKYSVLPSSSSPICCGVSSKPVLAASYGEDVDFEEQRPDRQTTVYCHLDVLAARELPAMDDDGLIDPSYQIEVKDQIVRYPSGTMKSLSPSFMHRVCIPIKMEVEQHGVSNFPIMAPTVPFPPIVLKILDRDDRKMLGFDLGSSDFEEVGSVVIKQESVRTSQTNGAIDVFPMLGFSEDKAVPGKSGAMFASVKPDDLDVNRHHIAKWHALDKPAKASFDAQSGGVDSSWHKRPRVLAAANYSMQGTLAPTMLGNEHKLLSLGNSTGSFSPTCHTLKTHESACFQLDFSILGLRNLPGMMADAKLYVSSFWEGPATELSISSNSIGPTAGSNNFMADELSEGVKARAKELEKLIRIETNESTESGEEDNEAPSKAPMGTLRIKDIIGVKIRPPLYEVPVIPYLQQDVLKGGKWTLKSTSGQEIHWTVHHDSGSSNFDVVDSADPGKIRYPGHLDRMRGEFKLKMKEVEWTGRLTNLGRQMEQTVAKKGKETVGSYTGKWHEEDPFVLLPALTFQLKNYLTNADYGTLTVGMNRLRHAIGLKKGKNESWMDICLKEYQALDQGLKEWRATIQNDSGQEVEKSGSIQLLRNMKIMEEAYESFVDVFAFKQGWLEFDENIAIGRILKDHCLFSIFANRDKDRDDPEGSDTFNQFFNPCDFLAGDTRFISDTFDDRVWPQLCCGPAKKSKAEGGGKKSLFAGVPEELAREELKDNCTISDAITWLEKKQKQVEHIQKRSDSPLPPEGVFEKFFSWAQTNPVVRDIPRKKEDLMNMSTKEISKKLSAAGWRQMSHLTAPEVDSTSASLTSLLPGSGGPNLANRHTFMVPVGHCIGGNRDSKFLCRLRMEMPRSFIESYIEQLKNYNELINDKSKDGIEYWETRKEQARHQAAAMIETLKRIDNSNANYFVIKFMLPGIVVWTAPESQKAWDKPGTLLFAVKLLNNPDVIVPVTLPSFDLRFPKESAWAPCKTLVRRMRTLIDYVEKIRMKDMAQKSATKPRESPATAESMDKAASKAKKVDLDDEEETVKPNGITRRIPVGTDGFICRLKRRPGGKIYDRVQGNDWYREVLQEAFPEIQELSVSGNRSNEDEKVKDFFFSKFMNLRRSLAVASDQVGLRGGDTELKGHINIERAYIKNEAEKEQQKKREVEYNDFAIESFWQSTSVFVTLTICTFAKLAVQHTGDAEHLYFKMVIGTEERTTKAISCGYGNIGKPAPVYQHLAFETSMPGASQLVIEVWAPGTIRDTKLGECVFDLEDRFLALKRKEFRMTTNAEFLRNNISPLDRRRYHWSPPPESLKWSEPEAPKEASEGRGLEVKPSRPNGHRSPLENKSFFLKDDDMTSEVKMGMMRCILDISQYPEASRPEPPASHDFEVRVSIMSVENIKIFRDFGERNDVFVQMRFRSFGTDGQETRQQKSTAVHRWANDTASFNERFVFPVSCPVTRASIDFHLLDFDRVSAADMIYYPQTFNLDHLLALEYENWSEEKDSIGPLPEQITFDSWPIKNIVAKYSRSVCCRCCSRNKAAAAAEDSVRKSKYAKLNIIVEVVAKEYADLQPATTGVFAPPKDRLSVQMLATNPVKTAKIMLGPTLYRQAQLLVIGFVALLVTLMILAIAYYVMYFADTTQDIVGG
eukprot:TRINITY_DN21795_c0_g1_i1.p1 TRINITY_DN21795_c0_g1~~TRINITY_DN21795_c0_g1_i1.p1  ORF type:complete len:2548 (+),score=544.12 TRINITY_DN21795_c0_g1_i1:683-7645(+)